MLSREQNELLTRTSAGTPMGDFMRRYWIPVLLSEQLPSTDCAYLTPTRLARMPTTA